MPELPEVEVTRRALLPHVVGARLQAVWLGKPLRWPLGVPPQQLQGRTVAALARRGKYLLLHLEAGGVLLVHLGMSGSLRWLPGAQPLAHAAGGEGEAGAGFVPQPHDHVVWVTDRGVLALHDPRRFGAVVYAPALDAPQAQALLGRLGMEPLEEGFSVRGLQAGLAASRAAVKAVLMSGRVVVGVGNIYASEALFHARIHPLTPAREVSRAAVARLHGAIVRVLEQAVALGGSSLRDFALPEGQAGHFQLATAVYGREGEPCGVCGSAIVRSVWGQRATYHCPRCQRLRRGAGAG